MALLRSALIALSRNHTLQEAIVGVPVTRRMARRFVVGETLAEALGAVIELNESGMAVTLDHLGENVTTRDAAVAAADEYLVALEEIHRAKARSNVSLKLTQMGLDLGEDFCLDNVSRVVRRAAELGNFVRVDMEGSPYTTRTLAIYRRLRRRFDNAGIVVQAYLHRSRGDVQSLIAEGYGHFRLCKGAYDEPAEIALRDKPAVTQAFNQLISTCLSADSRSKGAFCAVASHDQDVINFTRAYAYQHDVPPECYEFQMLYGIRRELQSGLVRLGCPVRVYVAYGTPWYPFYMRRLAERPANLLFFLRALSGD